MARYKTFDSTGVAPNGRLYAGDLNAIQDFLAKAADFTQTIDAGTLRIGDTSIQLLKFGTGEARVSAALRTDGIVRGLGGLYAGQFTTAGRPGAGSRPNGIVIFNTDLGRLEMNVGTDAAPSWQPLLVSTDVIQLPVGGMLDYAGSADLSSSVVLCDGRPISRTTYSVLFGLLGTNYGPGDGSSTFNIPDVRGRATVGTDNMGTAQGAANRIPNSNRARGQSGGEELHQILPGELAGHAHTHTGGHLHAPPGGGPKFAVTGNVAEGVIGTMNAYVPGDDPHSLWFSGGTAFTAPGSTDAAGSNTPHNNMQPYQVSNKLIRII